MLTPMTEDSAAGLQRRHAAVMEVGRRLADSPRWNKMCEGLEDDRDRSFTALYLQNQLDFMASNRPQIEVVSEGLNKLLEDQGIQETTRIVNIGNLRGTAV